MSAVPTRLCQDALNGLALDVKGVQDKQNLEAHIAAPELEIAADKAKGAAVTANLSMKDAARAEYAAPPSFVQEPAR